jgi:hypothetical protein
MATKPFTYRRPRVNFKLYIFYFLVYRARQKSNTIFDVVFAKSKTCLMKEIAEKGNK